jgi:RNA polymerase sigma-70 factor (ECF subfamily)
VARLLEKENAALVHGALQKLSAAHRRVLSLRFLKEMSLEEIREVAPCALGTVKSRLHYAKLGFEHAWGELVQG